MTIYLVTILTLELLFDRLFQRNFSLIHLTALRNAPYYSNTFFPTLTRNILLHAENSPEYQASRPRIVSNNFKKYGGNVKAIQTNGEQLAVVSGSRSSSVDRN